MNPPTLILHEFRTASPQTLETYLPYCLKVRRALNVLKLPYEVQTVDRPSELKALNPQGQAPVLSVEDEAVSDSTRILARLELLAEQPLHAPLTELQEADALLWEEFSDTTLNGFLVAARWADDDNWPRARQALFGGMPALIRALVLPRLRAQVVQRLVARDTWRAGAEACWERFELTLDQLNVRAPEQGFWVAPSLSAADLGMFGQLQSLCTELTPRQCQSVNRRPRLRAYLDRVDEQTRPAPH